MLLEGLLRSLLLLVPLVLLVLIHVPVCRHHAGALAIAAAEHLLELNTP